MQVEDPRAQWETDHLLLRAVFEWAGVSFYVLDANYRVIRASDAWLATVGLTAAQALGQDMRSLFPQDAETTERLHGRAHAGEIVRLRRHRQDVQSRETWWDVTIAPVRLADGAGTLLSAREITAEVLQEREQETLMRLAQLEADLGLLETLIEQMPVGVMIAEAPSGRILRGNRQVEAMWGRPVLPAMTIEEFQWERGVHPDGRPYEPDEWPLSRALGAGETVTSEEVHLRRDDGTTVVIGVSAAPIWDRGGQIVAAVSVTADITQQKRTEEARRFVWESTALLASSLDYETTLQNVADLLTSHFADWCSIHIAEEDGQVRPVALAHADPAKVQWAWDLQGRFPYDPDAPRGLPKVLRTGQSEFYPEISDDLLVESARSPEELEVMRTIGFGSVIIAPLQARGRTLGALTLVASSPNRRFDSSDLVRAETVAGRAAMAIDNARLFRQAQAALQARDEVLAIAAHDLKNPLTSIRGMAELLQRRISRMELNDGARLIEGLTIIRQTAGRMAQQLDELVDTARLELGQELTLDLAPADLVGLAQGVAALYQQTSERRRVVVQTEVASLVGRWDAPRLMRVLENLLSNAVKYSAADTQVTVAVRRVEDESGVYAEVAVQDQGFGIPAADLPYMFERFRRGSNVADRIAGTGLGLAGSRWIIELHGGAISIESQERVGTTVTVRLPIAG